MLDIDEPVNGTLTKESEENFHFRQFFRNRREHPELKWRSFDGTKHLKLRYNKDHVQVIGYFKHCDYKNGADLADQLCREAEIMAEALCEVNIKDEAKKITNGEEDE